MHPDDTNENAVLWQQAVDAVKVELHIQPSATMTYWTVTVDGEEIHRRHIDPQQSTARTIHQIIDAEMIARGVYRAALKQSTLSQEDFDSVLIGMSPVTVPPDGVPLTELFERYPPINPDMIFRGTDGDWRLYNFPGDVQLSGPAPSPAEPEYNEATDADTDLAGDETTGG